MTMPDLLPLAVQITKAIHEQDIGSPDGWEGCCAGNVSAVLKVLQEGQHMRELLQIEWRKGYQQGLIDAHKDAVEAIDDHNREEHGDDVD